jgi:iron complex outermembrane receptor protein
MKTVVRSVVFVFAAVLAMPLAYAQSANLEEIVVTARKRDELLVDIPVSAKAFTEDDIVSAGIEIPEDFIRLTPNVTLVQTQNAGNSFINIRGISQARNSEMSAAVLVDGVLLSNPVQFNQQLFDIQQIEVLRGPQGALYGRNAIAGAITVVTKQPTDEYEGKVVLGVDDGPGYKVQGAVSGPIADQWTFRVSGSYMDTDGWIDNTYLGEEADPYKDVSGRAMLRWDPSDNFSADLRVAASSLETQALYFNIAAEADDTSLPVRVNNAGTNDRDLLSASLKLDWDTGAGTLTSITAYDDTEEQLTGDQFNFLPPEESAINFLSDGLDPFFTGLKAFYGDEFIDLSQTQYYDIQSWSQEIRFVSPSEDRLRWIAGAYFIATDRFTSTGNQIDRGMGVFPVERIPRTPIFADPDEPSPQLSLLADDQDNFAWAVFGEIAYDFTDKFEAAFSLRYDYDERENTTLTDPLFDPTGPPGMGLTTFGEVRKEDWDDLQPKLTLTYKPRDNVTLYGGYSRGFRSGGFNQSGVGGAVPVAGVGDLFDEQTTDTVEAGAKTLLWDNRLNMSLAVFYSSFDGAYFFFFDPGTNTQNLGNVDETTYVGLEFEGDVLFTDWLSAYWGVGYTDSEIDKVSAPIPPQADNSSQVGNQAPLVSEYTVNLGGLVRYPIGGLYGVIRLDYSRIGDTWWDPDNTSKRSPIDVVDFRVGIEAEDNWSLMVWGKNAFDEEYNAEWSPGPFPGNHFLWKAPPARFGIEFIKSF